MHKPQQSEWKDTKKGLLVAACAANKDLLHSEREQISVPSLFACILSHSYAIPGRCTILHLSLFPLDLIRSHSIPSHSIPLRPRPDLGLAWPGLVILRCASLFGCLSACCTGYLLWMYCTNQHRLSLLIHTTKRNNPQADSRPSAVRYISHKREEN